ncbi:SCO family protein [Caldibacillus lycopersici]|uniref:SCO family protein n=1 Tax=Perspicuibacillus lycopersici TaxID=1325689 RepID=A0AAE3LT86_9BACI|nr:SCO family protein [Perspicuibacillus lycopersici]MCU9613633.1 SCO family protein [Perspicuibacillus lycopersici]
MKKIFLFVLLLFIVSGCGKQSIQNGVEWPIEDFKFINQNGESVSNVDLQGKVWIANFMFTNCTTVCGPMSANMARIQRLIAEEKLENVELVSLSVDPEVDSPEILKEYATRFTEDFSNWNFLTGYAQKFIEQFAFDNFHAHVIKPENDNQVIHGTDFYLVNQEGTIVKYYSGVSDVPYEEIMNDINLLLEK